ncbi:MAG: hypothetical protein KAF91_08305 [Nostoc sp. TH1S01]|nr:hypothetical protein [Nostoc sp. TH1S01]
MVNKYTIPIDSSYGSAFGDNATVNNYYSDGREEFVDIPLEDLNLRFNDSPQIKSDILHKLDQEKLLVLGGNLGVSKNELALQLAFLIADGNDICIKQWRRTSSQQLINIELELQQTDSPTVFVFTKIEPQDIGSGSGLSKAHKTAKFFQKHWVVISTDRSFTSWNLGDSAREFFPNWSLEDIFYSLDDLPQGDRTEYEDEYIRELFSESEQREQLLALGLSFFNGCLEDQLFAALEQVVLKAWRQRDPSLRALDYDDFKQLKENYFQFYSDKDLYGTASYKFKFVKIQNYPIDIRSIKILSENRLRLFKLSWDSHRRQIINALDVLAELIRESAVEENYFYPEKWELYGDQQRRDDLRRVISKTFSDIGLISNSSLRAVQGILSRLAINENAEIRSVAARTIARWYEPDNRYESKFFITTQNLYDFTLGKEARNLEISEEWLEIEKESKYSLVLNALNVDKAQHQKNKILGIIIWLFQSFQRIFKLSEDKKIKKNTYYIEGKALDAQDYMGATVAVTIGDAIYDYSGTETLSEEFYNWLEELAASRLRLVHHYFAYHTLYWVVPFHLKEERLRNILNEIIQKHTEVFYPSNFLSFAYSFNHAIARSLAHAYKYPENHLLVRKTLNEWYKEYTRGSNTDDSLLKTVLLSYGIIQYEEQSRFSVKLVFSRIAKALKKYPSVREAAVFAVCSLTRRYFYKIEFQLQDLLFNLNREEQQKVVKQLTDIYLEERLSLQGNAEDIDYRTIRINERVYQLWRNPENRPLTDIEHTMNEWAKLENKVAPQQTAIRALVSFAGALREKVEHQ